MSELEVKGAPPSPEGLYWRQAIQELRKDSLKRVEESARQLIALVTLLSGLYFTAISFGQVPKGVSVSLTAGLQVSVQVLFIGPLVLWMVCLLLASLALFPRREMVSPYEPDDVEQLVLRALAHKYRLLKAGLLLLVVSLGWLAVAAWHYLSIYVAKP